jgi:hypothetical protein
LALGMLLAAGRAGVADGGALMVLMNTLLVAVALVVVAALGRDLRSGVPWGTLAVAGAALLAVAAVAGPIEALGGGQAVQLASAVVAALAVIAVSVALSADLRSALRR